MARWHYVTASFTRALEVAAEALMEEKPEVRESWLDQCRTSAASRAAGGCFNLQQQHDWAVAFFAWYHGQARLLPREA